jgi:hypothetical protein
MPEILRAIANTLREFVGNRRKNPRHKVRLAAVVSLLDARANASPATVAGHTRDVSADGLGLVLPAIRIGERYLAGDRVTLRITIKLPDAHARLYGTPVRYERLEGEGSPDKGFLVGVRITEMDERDRELFTAYLLTIKQ